MAANRLGVLDGLRGIAILMVVWFHIWQMSWLGAPATWLQFIPETGFIGVAIFFFISGFVICYPFARARLEGGTAPSWGHFASRRAMKILPSYVLAIALAYATGYAWTQGGAGVPTDLLTHLLFVHNWFAATYGSINGVLWTLAVEVQFYCLFPFICTVFLRRPFLSAAVMMLIALAFRIRVAHCCAPFYNQLIEQLPAYFDFFACGMLSSWLYVFWRNRAPSAPALRWIATVGAAVGFLILIALMKSLFGVRYEPNGFGAWQVYYRTPLALDCGLIAVASLFAFPFWKRALANPALVFCSLVSYNWYIYHQLVARELWWHHLPPWRGTSNLMSAQSDHTWAFWFSIAAFVAGLTIATAVTFVFERPILGIHLPQVRARFAK
ncbi:MAG: hypothetical protein NVS9B12_10870 [Vulcanimicrobiaceae bacterium]